MISTKLISAWNDLPLDIKQDTSRFENSFINFNVFELIFLAWLQLEPFHRFLNNATFVYPFPILPINEMKCNVIHLHFKQTKLLMKESVIINKSSGGLCLLF